jgi:hypothetical protein
VQITAICPKCETRYTFDSAFIGKKVKCGKAECREVFEVRQSSGDPARAMRPAPRDRRAPTFETDSGEHEVVAAPDAPREADWSKLPPPPVRKSSDAPAHVEEPVVAEHDSGRASADEVMAMMGLAPAPAANGSSDDDYNVGEVAEVAEVEEIEAADGGVVDVDEEKDYTKLYHQYGHKTKRTWIWFTLLVMFIVVAVGGVGVFIYATRHKGDGLKKLVEDAQRGWESGDYATAAKKFDEAIAKDGTNEKVGEWRFLRDSSRALDLAFDTAKPADSRRSEFERYLASVRDGNDPNKDMLKAPNDKVQKAFVRIVQDQITDVNKKIDAKDFAGAAKGLDEANRGKEKATDYSADKKAAIPAELENKFQQITTKLQREKDVADFVKSIEDRFKKLSAAIITTVEKEAKEKGFDGRPEVIQLISAAKTKVLEGIKFTSADTPAKPPQPETLNSLILGPNVDAIPNNPKVVFAVARGVMYALVEAKGQILWSARVGIDDSSLPVRIAQAGSSPALAIVPSPDGKGLVAREVLTGKPRWFQDLPAALRGQPLQVEGRLIVPLADDKGTVCVVDSRDGRMLGSIELNQAIGAGAALQPYTTRVFIPAESQNVFVLDAKAAEDGSLLKFLAIIPTGHGPGSLRSEPVIVGGVDPVAGQLVGSGYMILSLSEGVSEMRLQSYEVPADVNLSRPGVMQKIPGWSSFAPVCDQEKIAVVTDAGTLALFGINQKNNNDPNLFGIKQFANKLKEPVGAGRGMIVHAEENDFWLIANGEMQHARMGLAKTGLTIASVWNAPLKLGTPLHAGQVSDDRSVLFVVTQTATPAAYLATAVNAKTGEIVWQRSLGLVPQGDPIRVGDDILQLDQGAGVYGLDTKSPPAADRSWALAGQVMVAPRLDVFGEPYLMSHASGKLAVLAYATDSGKKLNAVWVVPGQKASNPESVPLPAAPAGAPVLMDKTIIMPLADGGLYRWTIGEKEVKRGPDWRGSGLGENSKAYVTLIGKDRLLVTDGHHGLSEFQWPNGADFQSKTKFTVANQISSAPVVVQSKDGQPKVLVTDSVGRLYMFEGDPLGDMPSMRWEIRARRHGKEITAGPFVVQVKGEPRIIVVGDKTNVVCLGLDQQEAWTFSVKQKDFGGDGVLNRPLQIGNALVIGDASGRYIALDLETGSRLSDEPFPGLTALPAAPAAMPIECGPDRLFAPLTDGTVLLIPTSALLPKK